MNHTKLLSVLACYLVFSIEVSAEGRSQPDPGNTGYDLTIGIGAVSEESIYSGGKTATQLIPLIEWSWKHWFVKELRFGSYLAGGQDWWLSTSFGLDQLGDKDRGESTQFSDMEDLDQAFTIDVEFGWVKDWGSLGLNLEQDISGAHNGYGVLLEYSHGVPTDFLLIEPSIGVGYISSEVSDYYFGVNASEESPNRQQYRANTAFVIELGFNASYLLNHNSALFLGAGYQRFSNEITNSPLVERKGTFNINLGYLYVF